VWISLTRLLLINTVAAFRVVFQLQHEQILLYLWTRHPSNITDFVKKSYHAYFGVKVRDQDKTFAPHVRSKTCVENLCRWWNKSKDRLPFAVPMVWRVGIDHSSDCYFCMTNLEGEFIY
jgi:hypothetical protein